MGTSKGFKRSKSTDIVDIHTALAPEVDVTRAPYQGIRSYQDYYSNLQAHCFMYDEAISNILQNCLSPRKLKNMRDADKLRALEILVKAKKMSTDSYEHFSDKMTNMEFFKRLQDLERQRIVNEKGYIDVQVEEPKAVQALDEFENEVVELPVELLNTSADANLSEEEKAERTKEQEVLRLLQEAMVTKLNESTDSESK